MIKRTVEISKRGAHVSLRLEQLVIQPFDQPKVAAATIPCEDVGVLLVDHPATVITQAALAALMRYGAAVLICGKDHLPAGLMIPFSNHGELAWRIKDQINASKPLQKRLWQQIVQAKVHAQAQVILSNDVATRKLKTLATEVKSGDSTNIEAQAARVYWQAWRDRGGQYKDFQRNPKSNDLINVLLNYGYTAMRAAVARALVSAGMFPALGLHHSNRANAFSLADDLVEPLRPLVDRRVNRTLRQGCGELNHDAKSQLLTLLTTRVSIAGVSGPLMVALHRYTASLARCLSGQEKKLQIPVDGENSLC